MGSLRICVADDSREDQIRRLLEAVCREFGWNFHKDFRPMDCLPSFYERQGGRMFVALRDERVVGTIGYMKRGKTALLVRFYLFAEERGKGIGRLLYSTLRSDLRVAGIRRVFLGTEPENIVFLRPFLEEDHYRQLSRPLVRIRNERCSSYFGTSVH